MMNIRFLLYLGLSSSLLALLLALIALAPLWEAQPNQTVLPYNAVQGMAIESHGLLYTLNFDQQNQVITALNQRKNILPIENCAPTAEKLVIYRFNAFDWIIDLN